MSAPAPAAACGISCSLATLPNRASVIVVNDGSRTGPARSWKDAGAGSGPRNCDPCHKSRLRRCIGHRDAHAAALGFDYSLFMDSDLTNSPRDIPRFSEKMFGGVDVIKATRYSLGGSIQGVPMYSVAFPAVGNGLARWLFRMPAHDCTNGFRAMRCRMLGQMRQAERAFP